MYFIEIQVLEGGKNMNTRIRRGERSQCHLFCELNSRKIQVLFLAVFAKSAPVPCVLKHHMCVCGGVLNEA